jgi:mycoredoxin-dependent peroxiredoxin
MAQLRQDFSRFSKNNVALLVVGPDDRNAFKRYWASEELPYTGLADADHKVARQYGQQFKLLKFGRMPALMVIDKQGFIRYEHYAASMRDILPNRDLFAIIDQLNQESAE